MKFDELLTEHNIPVAPEGHEHKRSGWVQFDCPFCSPDWSHYRMGYNIAYRYVNCWACGSHGLLETLVALTQLSYTACRTLLDSVEHERAARLPKRIGKLVLPRQIYELSEAHKRYLYNRKFNPYRLERLWGIKGIRQAGRLSWRIFIPIHFAGEVASWTTRSISDSVHSRYITAKSSESVYDPKTLLYGEDYARHAIIIVEGPTDVWRIGPGAVAVLGTSYTQSQVLKMSKYQVRVVCFDLDAQKRARKLCDSLEVFPGDTYNVKLRAKDPGSAMMKEIDYLRKEFLV